MKLTTLVLTFSAAGSLAALPCAAQQVYSGEGHIMGTPAQLTWADAPAVAPGAKIAVIEGPLNKAVPFTFRLLLPANARIAPHSHPAYERVTVLSGTFHFAHGETFDPGKTQPLGPGSFAVMPPGAPMVALGATLFGQLSLGAAPLLRRQVPAPSQERQRDLHEHRQRRHRLRHREGVMLSVDGIVGEILGSRRDDGNVLQSELFDRLAQEFRLLPGRFEQRDHQLQPDDLDRDAGNARPGADIDRRGGERTRPLDRLQERQRLVQMTRLDRLGVAEGGQAVAAGFGDQEVAVPLEYRRLFTR